MSERPDSRLSDNGDEESVDRWDKLLKAPRVRVLDSYTSDVVVEGKVVGIIDSPFVIVEDDDGIRHYKPLSLVIEIEHREWRRS